MTSKEKLALIKETWYDVDLTDEKYIDFDEEQTFSDLEKDLERLEQIDNANHSEALKSLEELRDFRYGENKLLVCQTEMYSIIKQALLKAQKQDKILRIIKEKNVDIKQLKHYIQCYKKEVSLKTYNDYHNSKEELTQEEYDLFEEWLENEKNK